MLICVFAAIYILVVLYIWGIFGDRCIQRTLKAEFCQDIFDYAIIGYIGVTIYAEIFSLFYKVSVLANIILAALSILMVIVFRNSCKSSLHKWKKDIESKQKFFFVVSLLIFLLTIYIAATPIVFANSGDLGFYHAQCVRWIEKYGVTPGLANLFIRSGCNNANFCIDALFNFGEVFNEPLKIIGILLPMLVVLKVFKGLIVDQKSSVIKLYSLIVTAYSIIMILDMDNYSTEIASNYIVFYVMYRWIELIDQKENPDKYICEGYCILLLLFSVSIKLVTAPLCALVICPLYSLIKNKRYKEICWFIFWGVIIMTPWLVRNVITSGWIIFPYTFLDVFDVDWKVPKSAVDLFRQAAGLIMKRLYADTSDVPSFRQWMSGFFPFLWNPSGFNKYLLRMAAVLLALTPAVTCLNLIYTFAMHKKIDKTLLPTRIIMYLCLFVYLRLTADTRYFCQLIIPLTALEINEAIKQIDKENLQVAIIRGIYVLTFILLVPSVRISMHQLTNIPNGIMAYLINPGYLVEVASEDDPLEIQYRGYVYVTPGYAYKDVDGLKIWYNTGTTRFIFYDPFPGVPNVSYLESNYGITPHARGDSYKYGFYGIENQE